MGGGSSNPMLSPQTHPKPQGVGPESTIALKKLLPTCFAKMIHTTGSAVKVHEPFTNTSPYSFCKNYPHYSFSPESAKAFYTSHKIADSTFIVV